MERGLRPGLVRLAIVRTGSLGRAKADGWGYSQPGARRRNTALGPRKGGRFRVKAAANIQRWTSRPSPQTQRSAAIRGPAIDRRRRGWIWCAGCLVRGAKSALLQPFTSLYFQPKSQTQR